MPIVLKSGSLNLLEPSGPVQPCNGIALPLPLSLLKCTSIKILTLFPDEEPEVWVENFFHFLCIYGEMLRLDSKTGHDYPLDNMAVRFSLDFYMVQDI